MKVKDGTTRVLSDSEKWGCERPRKLPLKKERFLECFLGHLSFWVSGMESPLIFYTKKIRKTKYMIELFSSLIE